MPALPDAVGSPLMIRLLCKRRLLWPLRMKELCVVLRHTGPSGALNINAFTVLLWLSLHQTVSLIRCEIYIRLRPGLITTICDLNPGLINTTPRKRINACHVNAQITEAFHSLVENQIALPSDLGELTAAQFRIVFPDASLDYPGVKTLADYERLCNETG